jgi:hypothetical protein
MPMMRLLCVLALFLAQSACEPRVLKQACRDHSDCTDGRLCASVGGGPPTCVTLVADASVDGVDLLPPVNCDQIWQPTTVGDAAEIPPLLAGKWRKCGGGEPVNLTSPFEFTDDGKWYQLAPQSDGSTVRLNGWGQAGTWEVTSLDQLRLIINNAPGSSLTSNLLFMLEPRVMQFGPGLYSPLP